MKRKILFPILAVVLALSLALPMAAVVGADPGPGIVGLWHFDEGSGASTVADSSGNGNTGTVTGATTGVAGMFGNALSFDGTDDYVSVVHDTSLDMTSAYTLEAWVNVTDDLLPNKYRPILFRGTTDANDIEVYVQAASKDLMVAHNRGNGGTFDYVGFVDPPLGTWFHLAVTFDGTNVQAYYNGTAAGLSQQTTAMTAPSDTDKAWWIGKVDHSAFNYLASGNLHYFSGMIDEVRIWDTATPSFNLDAEPETDANGISLDHTVTATVTIDKVGDNGTEPAPGVMVNFDVTSGPNSGDTGSDYTDSNGDATFTYTGDGGAGSDTIDVSIGWDWSAAASEQVTKEWVELVSLTQLKAFNPVDTEHEVTATISSAVDGVEVWFDIDGPNSSESDSTTTDEFGVATFSYTGTNAGIDTITAYFDTNGNGIWDEGEPTTNTVTKYWLENFVTGGGIIKDGKKPAFTFAGTVGNLEDGSVGQFQIVDHDSKESWHAGNGDFSSLVFSGDEIVGPPGPSATNDTAIFVGTFTSNRGGSEILKITITDVDEPGKGHDVIKVQKANTADPDPEELGNWDDWFGTGPEEGIDGGNFQVHDLPAD